MFCSNCGKKLEGNGNHCPYCGAKVRGRPEEPVKNAGGKRGNVSFPAAAVALVVLVAVIFLGFRQFGGGRTLNPTDYVSLQVEGLDTEGKARLTFDKEKLLADIETKRTLTEREKEVIGVLVSDAEKDFSLSKSSGLSNGDEIRIESSLEKKLLKDYGISLKNDSVTVTVENLVAIQEVALGDYVTFEYHGFEGNGYGGAYLDWEGIYAVAGEQIRKADPSASAETFLQEELPQYLRAVSIEPNNMEQLSNGDEVTVTVSAGLSEISQYGLRFEGETISDTVEGLLPTENINLMEYLNCEFSGYSGAGYGDVTLDTERLAADLQELFRQDQRGAYGKLTEDDTEEESEAQEEELAREAADAADEIRSGWREYFTVELSGENLSNGDTVTLTCTASEEPFYLSWIGCCLEGGSVDIEVKGLEEPQDVDLAEALKIEFSGICPNVHVEREVNYDLPYVYDTSLYEMGGDEIITAQNGDIYEGEITYDERELLEQGYRVTNNKYSYTISGLNSYQLSCTSMEEEALVPMTEALLKEARRRAVAESKELLENLGLSNGWILWDRLEIVPESGKFAYLEEEDSTGNRLYLLYRASLPIRRQDRTAQQQDVHYVTVFYNVEETEDGTLVWTDWDQEWYLDGDSAAEAVRTAISDMGETVSVRELSVEETAKEEPVSFDLTEVTVSAEAEEEPQPGEILGNAGNLAAAVFLCDGHTYARYDRNLTWQLAEQFCEAAGGHLATVTSAKENAVIRRLLEEAPYGKYWLGATDEVWEGGWQWVTGEEFAWTNWSSGQPDNDGGNDEEEENYLVTGSSYSYNWNDLYGSNTEGGFLLEVEPAEKTGQSGQTKDLADLIPTFVNNAGITEYVQDPYGKEHFYSIYLEASENGAMVYDLNGEWTKLSVVLSTWPEAGSGASFDIGIWGDGKLLFSRYDYKKTDAPEKVCLDVTGVQQLSVITDNWGDYSSGYLFLHEGKLYGSGEAAKEAEPWREALSEVQNISTTEWEYWTDNGSMTDFAGENHRDTSRFNASEAGGGLWKLNGNYTSFAGSWTADRKAYGGETSVGVEILADGESLFREERLDIYQGSIPFEVDVTGKDVLEIRTWCNTEDTDLYAVLWDTSLIKDGIREDTEGAEKEAADMGMAVSAAEAAKTRIQFPEPVFPPVPEPIEKQAAAILTCGNYRYYRFDQAMTWKQAAAFCQAAGGSLACPAKEEKNSAVQILIDGGVWREYWLGGQKNPRAWEWSNGEPYTDYENWRSGQPDNYEDSEYLMSMDQSGDWNDLSDLDSTGFVMELRAVENLRKESEIGLGSLEMTEAQYSKVCNTMDLHNTLHRNSIELDTSKEAAFTVSLDGGYTEFSGTIHPYYYASDNVAMEIGIFGDGKCLYACKNLRKNSGDLNFRLDVTGVTVLSVVTCNKGSYSDGYLYLVEPILEPAENPAQEKVSRLGDLVSVDAVCVSGERKLFHDAYGLLHDQYLQMNAEEGASAVYNLDGAYAGFSGTITAAGKNTELGVRMKVTILADGGELWSTEFEKSEGPVKFEVDLTGKRVLEIKAETLEEGSGGEVFLTDDRLF